MAELMDIKAVIPNPDNPRFIRNEDYEKLLYSIQTFPSMTKLRKIIVNDQMIIQGGNMRYRACKELKKKKVYVDVYTQEMYQQDLKARRELAEKNGEEYKEESYEQLCKEFVIRDNVEFGQWNYDDLANEWEQDDLQKWGVINPDGWEQEQEAQEDDYEIPDVINTDIVLGDLIEIGEHRLLCGDSTDSDQVSKLMNGEKADMVFTDPPYLMDFQGNISWDEKNGTLPTYNAKHDGIKNDKMSKEDGEDFLDAINSNIQLFCIGAFYITFYRLGMDKYFASMNRTGLQCRSVIIWEKGNHTLSKSDYMSRYEPIFYGWVDKHNFYGGNNGMDVWQIDRTKKNELHPTMKPILLCEKAISDASKIEDKVLDLFLGSGSTMVAAHQLKRKCYGMELDPKYCQVIIDRMQKLDDTLDVKINGKIYEPELMTEL